MKSQQATGESGLVISLGGKFAGCAAFGSIYRRGRGREREREEGGKTARYSALTSKPAVARRTFPGIMLHEQINRRVRLTLWFLVSPLYTGSTPL